TVTGSAQVSGTKGYLAQELPERDRALSVYEYLTEHCAEDALSPKSLSRAMKDVNLPYDLAFSDQKMGTLSGGERVKLSLCTLLLNDCDVLLLDEPSNDLDLDTLLWLEQFLSSVRKTVLYISHDEVLLSRTAEEPGKRVETVDIPPHELAPRRTFAKNGAENAAVQTAIYPSAREVLIPQNITVHLGAPDSNAPNVTVPYTEYLKSVASSEIYPTWPESALRANLLAQNTLALNRKTVETRISRGKKLLAAIMKGETE
ncbi:MAG: ATP-binding cassette domain-containing protein, partial [Clostridia bacterium]|nr:ATP-binding cassette domain-containing protein [Clostridia bacterium]